MKGLFAARRKTLKNNLQTWLKVNEYPVELLDEVLSPELQTKRAETLTVQDFADLTNAIKKATRTA